MADRSKERSSAARSGDVAVFSDYLNETGQPFLLLTEPGGEQAHVRFTGRFEGEDVVWDCRFVTLDCELRRRPPATEGGLVNAPRSFIDIGHPGHSGVPLRVCLDLPRIDLPAIQKMIIMIRNYKRLRRGRHEFGETPGS